MFLLVSKYIFYMLHYAAYTGILLNNYNLNDVVDTVVDHKIYICLIALITVYKKQISHYLHL